jgi:6-phosphogluconolactonase
VGRAFHATGDPVAAAAALLVQALAAFPAPRLAVAGGSAASALVPARIHSWGQLRLAWVDERVVPFDHPESNRGAAWRAGRMLPPGFELPLVEDGETAQEAAARASAALRTTFGNGLDVLLLGMGDDGHIASLFPGRPWAGAHPVLVVQDSPKPPSLRLSLSLPFLQTASRAILLATGEAKRGVLLRLREGDPSLPAAHLPNLDVVTDLRLA